MKDKPTLHGPESQMLARKNKVELSKEKELKLRIMHHSINIHVRITLPKLSDWSPLRMKIVR